MQASSGRFCLLGVLLGGLRKKRDFLSSPFNVGYLEVILCWRAYLFSPYLHLYLPYYLLQALIPLYKAYMLGFGQVCKGS